MDQASLSDQGRSPVPPRPVRHHILSVLVENRSGVLARVASLFSRRAYNIFSLAVAPTEDERFSRITVVVDVDSAPLEQIINQLDKLVNVVSISELHPSRAREAELMLATVCAGAEQRAQVIELVELFHGRILDVSVEALTIELAGLPEDLDNFEQLVDPFGISELQRTGRIALPRLDQMAPPALGAAVRGAGRPRAVRASSIV